MFYLVVYDISSDKIRNKVCSVLKQYGRRVQYSAFEIEVTKEKVKRLLEEFREWINEETDSIFAFEIPKNSQKAIVKLEKKSFKNGEEYVL